MANVNQNIPSNKIHRQAYITLISGTACSISSVILNPFDVAKVRLQQQIRGNGNSITLPYTSMRNVVKRIVLEEGFHGLGRGIVTTVMRDMTYSSIRLGIYEPIRGILSGGVTSSSDIGYSVKIASGLLSGAIGAAITNPVDVVKTRYQVNRSTKPPYRNVFLAFSQIAATQGVIKGLWAGVGSTVARAALITSSQIGSYDVIKNNILIGKFGFKDNLSLQFLSSLMAGLITTTVSTPPDTIKTRVMADTQGLYRNSLDCAIKTIRNEGPMALMKGWTPAYLRLGPHTVISFVLIEKIRHLTGLGNI